MLCYKNMTRENKLRTLGIRNFTPLFYLKWLQSLSLIQMPIWQHKLLKLFTEGSVKKRWCSHLKSLHTIKILNWKSKHFKNNFSNWQRFHKVGIYWELFYGRHYMLHQRWITLKLSISDWKVNILPVSNEWSLFFCLYLRVGHASNHLGFAYSQGPLAGSELSFREQAVIIAAWALLDKGT